MQGHSTDTNRMETTCVDWIDVVQEAFINVNTPKDRIKMDVIKSFVIFLIKMSKKIKRKKITLDFECSFYLFYDRHFHSCQLTLQPDYFLEEHLK